MKRSAHLLFDESPLVVQRAMCRITGDANKALAVQQVHYLCNTRGVEYDGFRWVRMSYQEWAREFGYDTARTWARRFREAEETGVIVSVQPDAAKWDHTKYYRVDHDRLAELDAETEQSMTTGEDERTCQNGTIDDTKNVPSMRPRTHVLQQDKEQESETKREKQQQTPARAQDTAPAASRPSAAAAGPDTGRPSGKPTMRAVKSDDLFLALFKAEGFRAPALEAMAARAVADDVPYTTVTAWLDALRAGVKDGWIDDLHAFGAAWCRDHGFTTPKAPRRARDKPKALDGPDAIAEIKRRYAGYLQHAPVAAEGD